VVIGWITLRHNTKLYISRSFTTRKIELNHLWDIEKADFKQIEYFNVDHYFMTKVIELITIKDDYYRRYVELV